MEPVNIPVLKTQKLTIALLVTAPIFSAQAAIIEFNLSAASSTSISGNPTPVNNTETVTDTPNIESVNAVSYIDDIDNTGIISNSSFARTQGGDNGVFGIQTNGYGSFDSSAEFLQSYNVKNDALTDQFFDFNFSIENGSLNVGCNDNVIESDILIGNDGYGYGGDCNGAASASYDAEIRLNDVVIWNSMAELAFNGTDASLTPEGNQGTEVLGNYSPQSNYYSWNDQSFIIDLGTFSTNEEFTLDYKVTLTGAGTNAYSYAQFGDPTGFGLNGSPFTSSNTASVPEPSSLGIIAVGLGLLGFSRKK